MKSKEAVLKIFYATLAEYKHVCQQINDPDEDPAYDRLAVLLEILDQDDISEEYWDDIPIELL